MTLRVVVSDIERMSPPDSGTNSMNIKKHFLSLTNQGSMRFERCSLHLPLFDFHVLHLVDDLCELTLTDERELRWSTEQDAFVIVSPNDNGSSPTLQQFPSTVQSEDHRSRSLLCIRAPEGHSIVLQFIFNLPEESTSRTESSSCDPYSHDCTTPCVSVHEPKRTVDDNHKLFETINGSVLNVSHDISLEFFSLNYTQNHPRGNSTKFAEHIERFPRHSAGSSGDASLRTHNCSKKEGRRRQRNYFRKYAKRRNMSNKTRPKKRKRNRWKALAAELLIELHTTLLADREAAAAERNTKHVKHSPSLEVQEARERIFRFINSSRKGRRFAPPESLQRTALLESNTLQRMPSIHVLNSPPVKESKARDRERRRAEMSDTVFSTSEPPQTRLSSFTVCGPGPTSNISTVTGDSVQESLRYPEDFIRRELPLSFHSGGNEMRIHILRILSTDDVLFQFLQIKISFVSMQQETENMSITTNYVSNGDITPSRTQAIRFSTPESGNRTNLNDSSRIGDEVTVGHRDDKIYIIIGVGMGGGLVFVFTAICLILLCRKKRRAALSYASKSRQRGLVDKEETEKCLSSAENCEPRTDYSSPKKRKGPENNTQNLTEVNERSRMLEHKKYRRSHHRPGKVQRKEDVIDSRKTHETKHQQQSRQHVTQCKHLLTMRESSRHEHCIVCQIAGKPHQPITNAQYAAYSPPPSRHSNNSGFNSSTHDNFDKFNRMQNNPYRHSPSLMPKNASLPWTIKLPDGEERYKIRRDLKLHAEGFRDPSCVKPPPNRTIFASEALPFSGSSRQKHCERANGYPGPPTSISKSATFDRTGREGRSRISLKDDCICRYIINHIDEPPPEYSDVVRGDPLPLGAESIASNSGSPNMGLRENVDVLNSSPSV